MIDFSEMLPVGMVAHGGQVAQIMAEIAQRQRGLQGWEAFHYEKISDAAVELTGGIVSSNSGNKRWLEPHDCITIPFSAVIAEMQAQGLLSTATPVVDLAVDSDRNADKTTQKNRAYELNQPISVSNQDFTQLNVTFVLPADLLERQRILQAFHLQATIMGAQIIACRLE
jgi:hypothetical protein|nr:hypothetical protein [uncultured Undibacterium sp.]